MKLHKHRKDKPSLTSLLLHPGLDYLNARCWSSPICKQILSRLPKVPYFLLSCKKSCISSLFSWNAELSRGSCYWTQLPIAALAALNIAGWLSRAGAGGLQWVPDIRHLGLQQKPPQQPCPKAEMVTSESKAPGRQVLEYVKGKSFTSLWHTLRNCSAVNTRQDKNRNIFGFQSIFFFFFYCCIKIKSNSCYHFGYLKCLCPMTTNSYERQGERDIDLFPGTQRPQALVNNFIIKIHNLSLQMGIPN